MSELNLSLNKGLIVSELLIKHRQLTLRELHVHSKLTKQALLRCLGTLIERDWIRKRDNDKRYVWIGVPHSLQINRCEIMAKRCMPILHQLTLETGLAADLALINDQQLLTLIDSTSRKGVDGVNTYVAGHLPSLFMSALGRAFLFACDEQAFRHYYAQVLENGILAEKNHPNSARWREEKARFLLQGCSVREPNDYIPQAAYENSSSMAVAVPLNQDGKSIGAINLVWGDELISTTMVVTTHLPALLKVANKLSEVLEKSSL